MYVYVNAVLDSNNSITRMVFPSAVYPVIVGPVPDGQPSIPARVTCEEDAGATVTTGYEDDMLLFYVEVTP